jgi:hypothetical protein
MLWIIGMQACNFCLAEELADLTERHRLERCLSGYVKHLSHFKRERRYYQILFGLIVQDTAS